VPAWWLLCPYDTGSLGADVLEEAWRSHPFSQRGLVQVRTFPSGVVVRVHLYLR
jgi:hypothetical protein